MKDISSQLEILSEFLNADSAVDLSQLQAVLGGASRATVFRYLARLPYRRSYNHNGCYYTRHDPSRYDRFGLRVIADVRFSRDGSLQATVRRLVGESEPGCTQRELEQLLRVRVQSVLLAAVEQGGLVRQRVDGIYVYFHPKRVAHRAQLQRRREQCAAGVATAVPVEPAVDDQVVIEVLLVLIRHPGCQASNVVRRLRGRCPPITFQQVQAVFRRYDLDQVGEKGRRSTC